MSKMQMPKWMELTTIERHTLLGELVDAMIYSEDAVLVLRLTVEEFRRRGLIKSVILPEDEQ